MRERSGGNGSVFEVEASDEEEEEEGEEVEGNKSSDAVKNEFADDLIDAKEVANGNNFVSIPSINSIVLLLLLLVIVLFVVVVVVLLEGKVEIKVKVSEIKGKFELSTEVESVIGDKIDNRSNAVVNSILAKLNFNFKI